MRQINTCIYAPNETLKKDAATLAKIHGKSFSRFVWDVMQQMVEQEKERIEKYKELTEFQSEGIMNHGN